MSVIREPIVVPVAIAELRPTQITVGMREVEVKRKSWRERNAKKGGEYLGQHMMPTILGPKKRSYIIDHHHLALALHEEGVTDVLVSTVADLSALDAATFWTMMDAHGWVYPFDDKGRRRDYKDIPKSLRDLVDDPFRSLAGELRRVGGFSKETVPFSEFLWADFLRRHMKRAVVEQDFSKALKKALVLAKSHAANYLPGWCGRDPED